MGLAERGREMFEKERVVVCFFCISFVVLCLRCVCWRVWWEREGGKEIEREGEEEGESSGEEKNLSLFLPD